MVKRKLLWLLIAAAFFLSAGCAGSGTELVAEYVDEPSQPEETGDEYEAHELFEGGPGNTVSAASYLDTSDCVNTNIAEDFDGDGIRNVNETATNMWAADYPVIEAGISVPVHMKIEVKVGKNGVVIEHTSSIEDDHVESTKNRSTEEEHRNEINLKTVQFQDSMNESKSKSSTVKRAYEASFSSDSLLGGVSGSMAYSGEDSSSSSSSYGETKTKWADKPFKNNLNKKGWALRGEEASKKSRELRRETRSEDEVKTEVLPNAGKVTASLYIVNESVDMPVRVSNIMCSLMLETGSGELIPMQSFILRNEDYSVFEVDLYGGEEFSPYVIELDGLNTAEIQNAILKGYNPKIYIIDYDLAHVPDSNYRNLLTSPSNNGFSGDNVKIVEENAKGRTAGIKLVGPNLREYYRVSAFDLTDSSGNVIEDDGAVDIRRPSDYYLTAGVSLERALKRLELSGTDIETADIVLDYSDCLSGGRVKKFMARCVVSVNGYDSSLPLSERVAENPFIRDGRKVYVMKPVSEWTEEEIQKAAFWVIFADGRFYSPVAERRILDGTSSSAAGLPEFSYTEIGGNEVSVPVLGGIANTIWPGDHYDIVCLNIGEYLGLMDKFGYNPLQTGEKLAFNTRWTNESLGERPHDPDAESIYLGEAVQGDIITLNVALDRTMHLGPSFGTALREKPGASIYSDFSYILNGQERAVDSAFSPEEAVDMQVSFGLGGSRSDWYDVLAEPVYHSISWDYLTRTVQVRIEVPGSLEGMNPDGAVNLYLRTSPLSCYRECFWPLSWKDIRPFRGSVESIEPESEGLYVVTVTDITGDINLIDPDAGGNMVCITDGNEASYRVESLERQSTGSAVLRVRGLSSHHSEGDSVWAGEPAARESSPRLAISDGFFSSWNSYSNQQGWPEGRWHRLLNLSYDSTLMFKGCTTSGQALNWCGYGNDSYTECNSWADASDAGSFIPLANSSCFAEAGSERYHLVSSPGVVAGEVSLPNLFDIGAVGGLVRAAVSGDKALIAWLKEKDGVYTIQAGITGGIEGALVSNYVDVCSESAEPGNFEIVFNGRQAAVFWMAAAPNDGITVKSRMYHFDSAAGEIYPAGEEMRIVPNTYSASISFAAVSQNNRAYIVWAENHERGTRNAVIRYASIDMETGLIVSNPRQLLSRQQSYFTVPRLYSYGGRSCVVFRQGEYNLSRAVIHCYVLNSSGEPERNYVMFQEDSNFLSEPYIAGSGSSLLVAAYYTGISNRAVARVCRMAGNSVTNPFEISEEPGELSVTAHGGRCFAAWSGTVNSRKIARIREISISSASVAGGIFEVDNRAAGSHLNVSASCNGDRLLLCWDSQDDNSGTKSCGEMFYLSPAGIYSAGAGILETHSRGSILSVRLVAFGKGFIGTGRKAAFEENMLMISPGNSFGPECFLRAPLIERDYTVTAEIFE